MNKFKELKVWKSSISLTTEIYRLSESLPSSEKYGLVSQMTRSAVSIPSNIAEGAGRNTQKQFYQFLSISLGSSFELETQLIIAKNLGYITEDDLSKLSTELYEIQSMLIGLQRSLKV